MGDGFFVGWWLRVPSPKVVDWYNIFATKTSVVMWAITQMKNPIYTRLKKTSKKLWNNLSKLNYYYPLGELKNA
jgi:hypothetical protein